MAKQPQAPEGDSAPVTPAPGPLSFKDAKAVDPKPLEAAPIVAVRLELVDFSPTNPRKRAPTKEVLAELGESIRTLGLLQPIVVRKKGQRLELVFGECRVRAARLVKLEELPGRVVDMDDRAVIEAQLAENLRRSDLHPLEEAQGYRELIDRHGYTADTLAARLGKSKGYVYARLKLCALEDPRALKAFEAGELEASHALLIARVPKALQAEAFNVVERLPYRDAARRVQADFMLELRGAPFDTSSPDLVPKAGPCSSCPKRTGNQRELFADVRGADVCTDPPCFKAKADATFAETTKGVDKRAVLDEKKARGLFHGRELRGGTEFVDMDAPDALGVLANGWADRKGGKSLRQLLGKKAAPEHLAIARDEQGGAHWLVTKDEAREALKAAGVKSKSVELEEEREQGYRDRARADRKRADRKRQDGRALVEAVLERLSDGAGSPSAKMAMALGILVTFVIESASADVSREVAKARGVAKKGQHPTLYRTRELVADLVDSQPKGERPNARRMLAVELALQASVPGPWQAGIGAPLVYALEVCRLGQAAVVKRARLARKKAEAAKKKARAKNGAKPKGGA